MHFIVIVDINNTEPPGNRQTDKVFKGRITIETSTASNTNDQF